jgi:hypothetical protein
MDWILDNLQIVALALWALAVWIKKVIDHRIARRQAREFPPEPEELPDGFDREVDQEEEEISLDDWVERPSPPPPPSLPPPRSPPPLPPVAHPGGARNGSPYAESPHAGAWSTLSRQAEETLPPPAPPRESRATTTGGAAATRLRLGAERDPSTEPSNPSVRRRSAALKRQLAQPREIRRALVIKEILDAPVSLRSAGRP